MPFLEEESVDGTEIRGLRCCVRERDEYRLRAMLSRAMLFDETPRRSCGNAECASGWTMPWRSRRRPIFEGQWGCSGRCVLAIGAGGVEAGGRRWVVWLRVEESHRHRVPLGLVMLAQGWITHPQLQGRWRRSGTNGSGGLATGWSPSAGWSRSR